MTSLNDNFDKCINVAAEALSSKGHNHLDAKTQVSNIFAYGATENNFSSVINSDDNRVAAELRAQIKYICELGLDTAKGRKLVYVRTRGVNIGTREQKIWLTMPDIAESYHALIHVLVRSGALKGIVATHTYKNYPIEYSGSTSDAPIVKSWEVAPDSRGDYTGLFVVLTMPDGEIITSYHHASDIFATHRSFSKSTGTWKNHEQAMCAKSAILDAVRYIPVFDSVAASMVDHYDQSMDFETKAEDKITQDQITKIEDAIKEKGLNIGRLLKWHNSQTKGNISSISDINADFFDRVIQQIRGASK